MRKVSILLFLFSISHCCFSQSKNGLISGPWVGNVELRNATIWMEVSSEVKKISVEYISRSGRRKLGTALYKGQLGKEFNPVKIELNGLDINTTYSYIIYLDGNPVTFSYIFTTKDLWQYRKPAPDFNFLTGSCAYFNEPEFDRPGKPYGLDSSIFNTMANTQAAFNLWLGDSWYTREVDYSTAWGLNYRVSRDRSLRILQKFMASMPQYHIWDDHDYGPNNSGKSFILKKESREIFKAYTANPSYGEDDKGIYSMISHSDADFFLTDNRYFRSDMAMADSMNGQPNPEKTYFGRSQMDWLKNALLFSRATFKIISSGSQVLNPVSNRDCMHSYSYEFNELMDFLATHKITGVIFLTGDRHFSEVNKRDRSNMYTLYDITISPLTATVGTLRGAEINNPARVNGTLVLQQNFGNISITGKTGERVLKVIFTGIKGEELAGWSINESELR